MFSTLSGCCLFMSVEKLNPFCKQFYQNEYDFWVIRHLVCVQESKILELHGLKQISSMTTTDLSQKIFSWAASEAVESKLRSSKLIKAASLPAPVSSTKNALVPYELPLDRPTAPRLPTVTKPGGALNLTWDNPQYEGCGRLYGYFIEQREKGSENWFRINTIPLLPTAFNVTNLTKGRDYEFRIFAVNAAGLSPPSVASKMTKFTDSDTDIVAPKGPEFIRKLCDVLVDEHKHAMFECGIEGIPKPEVTWYKGRRQLFESSKYMMAVRGTTHTLTVNEVFGEDADEYSCQASNKGGSISSKVNLKIKTSPKIVVPARFGDVAVFDKGEYAVLKIPFSGYPRPEAVWKRDSGPIAGSRYSVETSERHAILTIRNVTQQDSGNYRLIVSNELGEDKCIIKLQINDRPDPPRSPNLEKVGNDTVTLSWKAPFSDGGSAIITYIIEKKEHPSSPWIRTASTRSTHHTVTNLNPQATYQFRVIAENLCGVSGPSIGVNLMSPFET